MISDSPAGSGEILARCTRHSEARHRKARLDEAQAHGPAHIAEADDRDGSRRNDGGIGGHGAILCGWGMTIGGVDCVFVSASKRPSLATCHTMRRSSNSDLILRRPPSLAAVSKDGHPLCTCPPPSLSLVFAAERSMPPP